MRVCGCMNRHSFGFLLLLDNPSRADQRCRVVMGLQGGRGEGRRSWELPCCTLPLLKLIKHDERTARDLCLKLVGNPSRADQRCRVVMGLQGSVQGSHGHGH